MSRCKTKDLSVERTASSSESDCVIGGAGFGIHVGRGGLGIHVGHYGGGGHGHGHGGHGQGHGGHGQGHCLPAHTWHDTSHFHHRPGYLQGHGGHFHYVPGGYQLHRSGHWHHNHR